MFINGGGQKVAWLPSPRFIVAFSSQPRKKPCIESDLSPRTSDTTFTLPAHARECASHALRSLLLVVLYAGRCEEDIPGSRCTTKRARARVTGLLGRGFFLFGVLLFRRCTGTSFPFLHETTARRLSRRGDITAAVTQQRLGLSPPPPSTVLVWRPARGFERSWREPRRGTLRRKLSFIPVTILATRA